MSKRTRSFVGVLNDCGRVVVLDSAYETSKTPCQGKSRNPKEFGSLAVGLAIPNSAQCISK